jgi:hypothetical protein
LQRYGRSIRQPYLLQAALRHTLLGSLSFGCPSRVNAVWRLKQAQGGGHTSPLERERSMLVETVWTVEVASRAAHLKQIVGAPGCSFQ